MPSKARPAEIIREARPDEQAILEDLQRRASLANPSDRELLLSRPHLIELPVELILAGRVLVAAHARTTAGFAVVLPCTKRRAELDGLFVEPDLWGRGVGRRLVDECVRKVRAEGGTHLDVVANPHALAFYLACGFADLGDVQLEFGSGRRMSLGIAANQGAAT